MAKRTMEPNMKEVKSWDGGFTGVTDIAVSYNPFSVRFISGSLVYLETMNENTQSLCSRYWSASGRINIPNEVFGDTSENKVIRLGVNDLNLTRFEFVSAQELEQSPKGARHFTVTLKSLEADVTVIVHTKIDGTPVLVRWLEVINDSPDKPAAIYEFAPLSTQLWRQGKYTLGYFRRDEWACEGWFEWSEIRPGATSFEHASGLGFRLPFFMVRNEITGEYFGGSLAWNANWKMEFKVNGEGLFFTAKSISAAAQCVLSPGESIRGPELHLACGADSLDQFVQNYHTHLRNFALSYMDDDKAMRIQYLVPGDQGFYLPIDEEAIRNCIHVAEACGAEVFVLDAYWWDVTCDWEPSATRFPNGLKHLIAYAKSKGMKFSLYFETEGGRGNVEESKVFREHPDWFFHKCHILDLSVPEAAEYFEKETCRIIEEYELDIFRMDYNPMFYGDGTFHNKFGISENHHLRHYNTLQEIYARIAEKYPNVLLQQAAAGGGRNDLATAMAFHESYLTDGLSIPRELFVYAGLTLALPPDIFCILHGADGGMHNIKPQNFNTYLRLTFALCIPQIFVSMSAPTVDELTPQRRARFLKYTKLYQEFFRPILRKCKLYHHEPINANGGVTSSTWFASEFATPERDKGWAVIIRMVNKPGNDYYFNYGIEYGDTAGMPVVDFDCSPNYLFRPRGLNPAKTYRVTIDSLEVSYNVPGYELMRDGLNMYLEHIGMSELVLFEEV